GDSYRCQLRCLCDDALAMQITALAVLVVAVVMALAARHHTGLLPDQNESADASLVNAFHASDPRFAGQLLSGFHSPEAGGRWTMSRLGVMLAVPRETGQPVLKLTVFIPENERAALKSITLTATAGGVALDPETFATAGIHT